MDRKVKHFLNSLKKISLQPEEILLMRHSLVARIRVSGTNVTEFNHQATWSRFQWRLVLMPLVAVLVLSGVVSSAAESSLPGQLLYPVKIGVNEELGRWFTTSGSDYGVVLDYEYRLLEKRFKEAEQLDNLSKLDGALKQIVRANVVNQQTKVSKVLEIIKPEVAVASPKETSETSLSQDRVDLTSQGLAEEIVDSEVPSSKAVFESAVTIDRPETKPVEDSESVKGLEVANISDEPVVISDPGTILKEVSEVAKTELNTKLNKIIDTHQGIIEKLEIQIDKSQLLPAVGGLKLN